MKKYICAIAISITTLLCSCTTSTSDTSFAEAQKGNFITKYGGYTESDADVSKAVISALRMRGWQISETSPTIKASIVRGGQNAKVSIEVKSGVVIFDSTGSVANDEPYVPIRYIDYVIKTANNILAK